MFSRHLERGWTDAGLDTSGLELGIGFMKPTTSADTIEILLARSRAARSAAEIPPPARVA